MHLKNTRRGTSLVVQWMRICLPVQGTLVWSLVREDFTYHGATKPVRHNYWARTLGPSSRVSWARVLQLLKPVCPRAHALQQRVAPACDWRKAACSNEDSEQPKIKWVKFKTFFKCHKIILHFYWDCWQIIPAYVIIVSWIVPLPRTSTWNLRMWPYLEIKSLQIKSVMDFKRSSPWI